MAFAENNLMPINETSTNIQAYKTIYANTDTSKNTFDIKESYKIFDQTNLKLSTQNLDIHDLVHAIKLFKKLNSDAEECIETTQKRLSNINNLIQLTSPAINEKPISPEITADQAYLKKEQKELTNRQAQCRLFTIKSGEVITRYQSVVAELKKVETFSQSSPAWEYLPKFKHLWQEHKLFKTELSINQFEFEWQKWFIHAILSLFTTIAILWIFSYKTNLKRIFSLKQYYFSWMSSLFLSIWFLYNLITRKTGSWSRGVNDYSYLLNSHKKPDYIQNNNSIARKPPQESKGELECRRVMEKIFNKPFPKCRPDFLRNSVTSDEYSSNNLEIDCYNHQLKIGVEYNGIQHYKYIPFFHKNKEAFYNQKYRDEMKRVKCQQNNIFLIEVPYYIQNNQIEDYIKTKLVRAKMD